MAELPDSGAQAAVLSPAVIVKQLIYSVLADCSALQLFVLGFASSGHAAFAFPPVTNLAVQGAERALAAGTAVARNPRLHGAFTELCLLLKWSFS